MESVLGSKTLLHKNNKDVTEVKVTDVHLEQGTYICLYFTASSCAPCVKFRGLLKTSFKRWLKQKRNILVILCNKEKDEKGFQAGFKRLPPEWYVLPFSSAISTELCSRFDVTSVPSLVVIKSDGKIVKKEAELDVIHKLDKAWDIWMEDAKKCK
eukprot:TRINITY_DN9509_c0_g1_i1.p1 TRINITY_DN9509_c0_g1~~TRINITY_DN9509_c0_g1_i1.p1  ORF type:complete len:155 (+),score=21.25 TRINITY_DN9509_c0_g1_i1:114-578(+)